MAAVAREFEICSPFFSWPHWQRERVRLADTTCIYRVKQTKRYVESDVRIVKAVKSLKLWRQSTRCS